MGQVDDRIEHAIRGVLEVHRNEDWDPRLRADLARDIRIKLQREGLAPALTESRSVLPPVPSNAQWE